MLAAGGVWASIVAVPRCGMDANMSIIAASRRGARDSHMYCTVKQRTRRILDPDEIGQWKNEFFRHKGCHWLVEIFSGPNQGTKSTCIKRVAYLDYRIITTAV